MSAAGSVKYLCTREMFHAASMEHTRWLAPHADFYRYQQMLRTRGVEAPTLETWETWHSEGYGFCAVVLQGAILSVGTLMKHSNTDWEIAGIRTLEAHQRLGYGKAVASFLTDYILNEQVQSVCHAPEDNIVMRHILEKLGYQSVSK